MLGLVVCGSRTWMWTMAAPALAASIADCAICAGVTGTAGFLPGVSAEPVTAQAIITLRFMFPPAGACRASLAHVRATWTPVRPGVGDRGRTRPAARSCGVDPGQSGRPWAWAKCDSFRSARERRQEVRGPRRFGGFAGALLLFFSHLIGSPAARIDALRRHHFA